MFILFHVGPSGVQFVRAVGDGDEEAENFSTDPRKYFDGDRNIEGHTCRSRESEGWRYYGRNVD